MMKHKKKIIIAVAVGILVIIVRMLFGGAEEISYDTVIAERINLVQEINAVGRVEAVESVDLAFENSGRVARVYVDVGDKVYRGETLVVLGNLEEVAKIAQAEAILAKNEAKLLELKNGVRPEEILVQKIKVNNTETSLRDAVRGIVDELRDSYTKADDSVRSKIDQFFSNPRTPSPQLDFYADSQLKSDIEQERFFVELMLGEWGNSLLTLTNSSDIEAYTREASQNLSMIKSLLDKSGLAVNSLTVTSSISQTTIDAWKLDVYTARININTAIASITSANEKVEIAKSSLSLAKQELALKESGTIGELIVAQEAQVKESEANVKYYKAQFRKSIISSPINGVVTTQNAKVGEIVAVNAVVVSIISDGEYEIEAFVVEADIANLRVGNVATFSLDAYTEEEIFTAVVESIDPAAQLFEGVANYRTILRLQDVDDRVRAGMTADLDIVTDERENVVSILQRAVIFKDNKKIVRKLIDGVIQEVEVKTGTTGNRGQIEILSGVEEGDVIVTSIKK